MSQVELHCGDCLPWLQALPDNYFDLHFSSPPYGKQRTYGVGADRASAAWVEWMRPIVREMCRTSSGLVFINVSDGVENCKYLNGPEWLHADLTRIDGLAAIRPYCWVKSGPGFDDRGNGQPGSGANHFHRNDYEMIFGYAEPDKLPPKWSDNLAFGLPPAYSTHGPMSYRNKTGERRTTSQTRRKEAGVRLRDGDYTDPEIANAGNVIRARVGGGNLGHPLAHEGEAPMPVAVAERFVCWFCPPGGRVGDAFTGTGTTMQAAIENGRKFSGCDLRESQIAISKRRLSGLTPRLNTLADST